MATAVRPLTEIELAERCRARDRDAIRAIVTANNQRLFRAAWSILKDRSEAEEAVQSAYLSAFDGLDTFEARSSLSTWLTRIVINESLGRLRAQKRRRDHLEGAGVAVLEDYREALMGGSEARPPDAALAREQMRLLLEQAVSALPEAFRTVFVLNFNNKPKESQQGVENLMGLFKSGHGNYFLECVPPPPRRGG